MTAESECQQGLNYPRLTSMFAYFIYVSGCISPTITYDIDKYRGSSSHETAFPHLGLLFHQIQAYFRRSHSYLSDYTIPDFGGSIRIPDLVFWSSWSHWSQRLGLRSLPRGYPTRGFGSCWIYWLPSKRPGLSICFNMSSSYAVKELETREQMDELVEVIWKAQYSPYMPSAGIFWPIFGHAPEDRARAIQASKDRLWMEYSAANRETHHWILVEHLESKKIVAGCQWVWYEKSRFTDGIPKVDVYWWPPGETKEFCEHMLQQIVTPRCL